MKKNGLVGQGCVCKAVYETMKNHYNVETFDTIKISTCESLEELIHKTDVIFLCLPTPMLKNGECDLSIIKTGSTTAEMVKYFANCFLATKVSFANEMKQFCDKKNIDYDKVVEYALYDNRIGQSHLGVPGPDGKLGFGGSCFPKDINALIHEMKKEDVNPSMLEATWKKNLLVRPEKDWEKLKGRAVSE